MKKPSKPKFAKYPKKPKKSASLSTLENYKRRCQDVDRRNAEKAHDYNRKIADIKKAKSMREGIHGIGNKPKVHKLHTL